MDESKRYVYSSYAKRRRFSYRYGGGITGYSLDSADSDSGVSTNSLDDSDNTEKVYTQDELSSMTVSEIKAIASERGYAITKTLKADVINEFLSQQN